MSDSTACLFLSVHFGGLAEFGCVGGSTTGIMSYSPTANKVFTFTATNPSEICSHVNAVKGVCYSAWRSTCGNGIIEPGEDCDDTTNCCDRTTCKLVGGATCSPGIDPVCCRYAHKCTHTHTPGHFPVPSVAGRGDASP